MRLLLLLTLALSVASFAQAQIVLGRQVIGAAAVNGSTSGTSVSSTVGEPAVAAYSNGSTVLTEGFEQPNIQPFLAEYNINYQDCWSGSNAQLELLINGCGDSFEVELLDESGSAKALDGLAVGTYTLTVTTSGGCTFTDEVIVVQPMLPPCDLNVYDLITPNNDGANDFWFIDGLEHPDYTQNNVRIFNRWGQLVWEAQRYDNGGVRFEGRDKNDEQLPEGAYFYEIELPDGEVFTGSITLLQ